MSPSVGEHREFRHLPLDQRAGVVLDHHLVAALALGVEAGAIGAGDERFRRQSGCEPEQADAGGDGEAAIGNAKWFAGDRLQRTQRQLPVIRAAVRIEERGELVAAQAGHRGLVAESRLQPADDFLQHDVSGGMPEQVVEELEAVEVEVDQRDLADVVGGHAAVEQAGDAAAKPAAVERTGEGVVFGGMGKPAFGVLVFRDVGHAGFE